MEEKAPTTMEWACGGRLRVSGEADEVCLAISSMLDGAHVGTGLYGFITTSTGPMFVKMASRSRRRRKVWSIAPKLTSPRPTCIKRETGNAHAERRAPKRKPPPFAR
eukprot:scaffold2782_cov112-Isochrysis_galbana.AAC.7